MKNNCLNCVKVGDKRHKHANCMYFDIIAAFSYTGHADKCRLCRMFVPEWR